MADAVSVFVCRKCRGASHTTELLADAMEVPVHAVRCQKICADHVVGVRRDGQLVWFEEVDSAPRRRALVRFVTASGPAVIPKRLRRLVVRKRAGRLRS